MEKMFDKEFISHIDKAKSVLIDNHAFHKDLYLTLSKEFYDSLSQEERINVYQHYQGIKVYFIQNNKAYLLNEKGELVDE